MTDPFDALRPPRRPLPVGGDDVAVTRGRRILHRRRAAAGGTAAAGLLAVGSVVAFSGAGSRPDSIGVLNPDRSPTPGSAPTGFESTAVPSALPSAGPSVSAGPLLSASPKPARTPQPTRDPSEPIPYVGPEPTDAQGLPFIRRVISPHDPQYCAVNAQGAGRAVGDGYGDWCARLSGPSEVVAGSPSEWRYELCRLTAADPITLHFATPQEVRFVAQGPDRPDFEYSIWRWDQDIEFPQVGHDLTIDGGECAIWYITWSGQDDTGYAMEPGRVRMTAEPVADDEGNQGVSLWQQKSATTTIRWS